VLAWSDAAPINWIERSSHRAAYRMRFDGFTLDAELAVRADDAFDLTFTVSNATRLPATFGTTSCFNLQAHPRFYDCEQLRTFTLDAEQKFVPLRRFSRKGECVRWITGMDPVELGKGIPWALLAVVSRGGPPGVIATARAGEGGEYSLSTNALFTCLHADATVRIPASGKVSTRQMFYLIPGGLETLLKRFRADFRVQPGAQGTTR
jgi:hypothetical protein